MAKKDVKEEKKGRGRPKKTLEESLATPKKSKKKESPSLDAIPSMDEIKEKLLKKCKGEGFIEQSEIYESFEDYELDDDAVQDLIKFFQDNKIEVITDDSEEEIKMLL